MRRVGQRPDSSSVRRDSEWAIWLGLAACFPVLLMILLQPAPRRLVPARLPPLVGLVTQLHLRPLGDAQPSVVRETQKLRFPEWMEYVEPSRLVWMETGIRTSRPCVETRYRSVRILAQQRRFVWTEGYPTSTWRAIRAEGKQALTLVVRIEAATRYEHLGFERVLTAWQVTNAARDHDVYTWIPPDGLQQDVLRRAIELRWARPTPNDPELEPHVRWLIRHCRDVRRFSPG